MKTRREEKIRNGIHLRHLHTQTQKHTSNITWINRSKKKGGYIQSTNGKLDRLNAVRCSTIKYRIKYNSTQHQATKLLNLIVSYTIHVYLTHPNIDCRGILRESKS